MKPEQLRERLRKLNKGLDMVIYRTDNMNRAHGGLCSITHRGDHVMSVSNSFIPRFKNKQYSREYLKDDRKSTGHIVHASVYIVALRLFRKRHLTRSEAKTLYI